jgi:hypothetical protein
MAEHDLGLQRAGREVAGVNLERLVELLAGAVEVAAVEQELGERESIAAAYAQGCAAIGLECLPAADRPQLAVRDGVDAEQLVLAAEGPASGVDRLAQRSAGPP